MVHSLRSFQLNSFIILTYMIYNLYLYNCNIVNTSLIMSAVFADKICFNQGDINRIEEAVVHSYQKQLYHFEYTAHIKVR